VRVEDDVLLWWSLGHDHRDALVGLEPGQHQLALPGQLVAERRALLDRSARRRRARARVRVVIGLRDRDLLVVVLVGRAAHARHEVMGEHRALERARLLRELVGTAARQQHHARQLRVHDIDDELVGLRAALARHRPGLAGVDDPELDGRGQAAQRVLQLLVRHRIAAQVEVLVVGVARIIDEHEGVLIRRVARGVRELAQRTADVGGARVPHELHAVRREPTERDQHVAHALRIVVGVAQRPILGPARVRPDDQGVALLGERRGTRRDERCDDACDPNHATDQRPAHQKVPDERQSPV